MKLTKIGYAGGPLPSMNVSMSNFNDSGISAYILVPDEQTLHEVRGLAFLFNKDVLVNILEPWKPLAWDSSSYSPWHVNTDIYTLTFGITNELQTPHLVYAPSYLTAYKD